MEKESWWEKHPIFTTLAALFALDMVCETVQACFGKKREEEKKDNETT